MSYSELVSHPCKCWSKALHDLHCMNCGAPLIVAASREAYITKSGDSATFCDRIECQDAADKNDAMYGIPPVEVMRRRDPKGLRSGS